MTVSKPAFAAALAMVAAAATAQQPVAPQPNRQPTYTIGQLPQPGPLTPNPNAYPNPYTADASFFKMPAGRVMGSTSAVATDSKGHIWIAERCGANSCAGSAVNPIIAFDKDGNFLRNFGGGEFAGSFRTGEQRRLCGRGKNFSDEYGFRKRCRGAQFGRRENRRQAN